MMEALRLLALSRGDREVEHRSSLGWLRVVPEETVVLLRAGSFRVSGVVALSLFEGCSHLSLGYRVS